MGGDFIYTFTLIQKVSTHSNPEHEFHANLPWALKDAQYALLSFWSHRNVLWMHLSNLWKPQLQTPNSVNDVLDRATFFFQGRSMLAAALVYKNANLVSTPYRPFEHLMRFLLRPNQPSHNKKEVVENERRIRRCTSGFTLGRYKKKMWPFSSTLTPADSSLTAFSSLSCSPFCTLAGGSSFAVSSFVSLVRFFGAIMWCVYIIKQEAIVNAIWLHSLYTLAWDPIYARVSQTLAVAHDVLLQNPTRLCNSYEDISHLI